MTKKSDAPQTESDQAPRPTNPLATAEANSVLVQGGPFYRSFYKRAIAGVFSGLAIRAGISPGLGQIIGLVLFLLTGGLLLVAYLILWLVIPYEPVPEDIKKAVNSKKSAQSVIILSAIVAAIVVLLVVLN